MFRFLFIYFKTIQHLLEGFGETSRLDYVLPSLAGGVWSNCLLLQEEAEEEEQAEAEEEAAAAVADAARCSRCRQSAHCTGACCHGGAKMAVLAYSLGKREINHYFTIRNAKLISLALVVVLLLSHTVSRYYGGKCPSFVLN